MTTTRQLKLFRMLNPREPIKLSPTQREVLEWVEYSEGVFETWPRIFRARTLRQMMAHKLIEVIGYRPARYRLTPYGRAVRARYARGREVKGRGLLGTEQFFRDSAEE